MKAKGYSIKLQDPARRAQVALLENGEWAVRFKMVVGCQEARETKFILSDEAMWHAVNMYMRIKEENKNE